MFDRQSLVNVRTKFHDDRLIRFRDILHTVSKNLISRKTRLKFQNVIFDMYLLLAFFTYIYRGSQFLQFTAKLNPSPLHFIILLKVVNSDTNSIIQYSVADLLLYPQNKSF